jgi:hypothetical protein
MKPMTKLLEKDKKFKWTPACKASFQELKERLTTALVLVMPDMENHFLSNMMHQNKVYDVCSCKMVTW